MTSIGTMTGGIETPAARPDDMMEEVKNISKRRMEREVFSDPSKAKELMKAESTVVYNARGDLIIATARS